MGRDGRAPTVGLVDVSVRVLIADDQQLVRSGFRMMLEAEGDIEVVGEAADGQEAVSMARGLEPDLALIDLRMPRMDGIEATTRTAAASSSGGASLSMKPLAPARSAA